MIEVDVHQQLRAYLRAKGGQAWPHHLTLARMVARTLRLERNAFIHVSGQAAYEHLYGLSYLLPLLLLPGPAIVVAPEPEKQRLLQTHLPNLREFFPIHKPMATRCPRPGEGFSGVLVLTQAEWWQVLLSGTFDLPKRIAIVMDGLEDLITTGQEIRSIMIKPSDWDDLIFLFPQQRDGIRAVQVKLFHQAFQHPANPYQRHRLTSTEIQLFQTLLSILREVEPNLPPPWLAWQSIVQNPVAASTCLTLSRDQHHGQVHYRATPLKSSDQLQPLWSQHPLVLISRHLDPTSQSLRFCQDLGLGSLEFTFLSFPPDRHRETLTLFLPSQLPLPNTPEFAQHLHTHLCQLLLKLQPPATPNPLGSSSRPPVVVIVDDVPLREQVAAGLAAQFGSQVQVEAPHTETQGVLVCGWEFWVHHSRQFPAPAALCLATLPIPSREHPYIASQIEAYKQRGLDWFREFLWVECLRRLDKIITPLRGKSTLLGIYDTRVLFRSYGQDVLTLLTPYEPLETLDDLLPNGEPHSLPLSS